MTHRFQEQIDDLKEKHRSCKFYQKWWDDEANKVRYQLGAIETKIAVALRTSEDFRKKADIVQEALNLLEDSP